MVIYLYRLIFALILLLLSSCIDDPISSIISDNFISSITKSDNALFITTSDGRILTSVDGKNWDAIPINNSLLLLEIESNENGYIAAVGNSGVVFTSSNNGTSWNKRSSGVFSFLSDVVIYNDSTYFAGGNSGNLIKTTDFGETWEAIITPFSTQITSLTIKDNDLFIGLREKSIDSLFLYKYEINNELMLGIDIEINSFVSSITTINNELYFADYDGFHQLIDNSGAYSKNTIYSNSNEVFIIQEILRDDSGFVLAGYEGFNLGKVLTEVPNNNKVKIFNESIYFNTGILFDNKLIVCGGDEYEIAIRESNNWEIIKLK